MRGYPTVQEAEGLIKTAEERNPGPLGDHSRTAAFCARRIAEKVGLDGEKAYVLGLLHDIGRHFGVRHLGHVYDGYRYMMDLGYPDAAKICLTHSFNQPKLEVYIGKFDISQEQQQELQALLHATVYDDYDRLIQLCDCLAGNGQVMDMEARMLDVKKRYGFYSQEKWDTNMALKRYFEEKAGMDIYELLK